MPPGKMRAAKQATKAAVDCIRDGVLFRRHQRRDPRPDGSYPNAVPLAVASSQTRKDARGAIEDLWPGDGTAIGTWLSLAAELFSTAPEAIHHAILLTDGQNEEETPEQLDAVLERCEGRFQCDCRGVGTDWEVGELRRIASALLGTVDIVREPEALAADFTAMIERAMTKDTNNVALRLWTPQGAEVAFVKQVSPTIEDLTDRGRPSMP